MKVKITDEAPVEVPKVQRPGAGRRTDKYGLSTHKPGQNWLVSPADGVSADLFCGRVQQIAGHRGKMMGAKFITRRVLDDNGDFVGVRIWRVE